MALDNETILKITKRILLREPEYQYPNQTYQLVWRFWEEAIGKPFYSLSKEGFIHFNVKHGTVESILRARRKVLEEIKNEKANEQRYLKAEKHRKDYKNNNNETTNPKPKNS